MTGLLTLLCADSLIHSAHLAWVGYELRRVREVLLEGCRATHALAERTVAMDRRLEAAEAGTVRMRATVLDLPGSRHKPN